jgi:hypothetical protein
MASPIITLGAEEATFYALLGRCVAKWAHIEFGMFTVAQCAFLDEQAELLANGYYSIENFRSKLAFVERVIQASAVKQEFKTEWAGIRERVRSLSKKRNDVAHSRVLMFSRAPQGRRVAIVPTFIDEPKKKPAPHLPPPGSLCLRDLDLIRLQFGTAANALSSLHLRMSGKADWLAASAQRAIPIAGSDSAPDSRSV